MAAHVVVIGAGMAGLAAGWELSRGGVDVTVLERDARVGGRVHTGTVGGLPVELGAAFLTNFYPRTLDLARRAGLDAGEPPAPTRGAILRGGRLFATSPALSLLSSRLLPLRSKVRLLKTAWTVLRHRHILDHEAMWRADQLDTRSVSAYALADLDPEILEYVFAPSLRGFLYWEPEETSQAMLFLMLKQAPGMRHAPVPGGRLSALPERLAESTTLLLGTAVHGIQARSQGGYTVRAHADGAERLLTADGVVCATSATQVPGLLPELSPAQREFFTSVRYSSTISVAIPARGRPLQPYTGVLVPRCEAPRVAAATRRTLGRGSTDGPRDVLMVFASDEGARQLRDAGDREAMDALLADLAQVGGVHPADLDRDGAVLQRWGEALPVFDVGHLHSLRRFAQGEFESGPLVFAGDYLGGPFIEGAVSSGIDAARRLLTRLGRPSGGT